MTLCHNRPEKILPLFQCIRNSYMSNHSVFSFHILLGRHLCSLGTKFYKIFLKQIFKISSLLPCLPQNSHLNSLGLTEDSSSWTQSDRHHSVLRTAPYPHNPEVSLQGHTFQASYFLQNRLSLFC